MIFNEKELKTRDRMRKAIGHLRKAQELIDKAAPLGSWGYNALKHIEVAREEILNRFDTVMVKPSCSTPGCPRPAEAYPSVGNPQHAAQPLPGKLYCWKCNQLWAT
jgi:hypothetical protein